MNHWIRAIFLAFASLLFVGPVSAQTVIIIEVADGQYVGMAIAPDGTQFALTTANITIKKLKATPPVVIVEKKPTQVTFIYEKDTHNVPRQVSFALRQLNDQGILATEFEEDSTVDGTPGGRVPSQYKVALEAAKKEGTDPTTTADIPVLVVQAGDTVVRIVKNPTTESQVLEAAK